MPRMRHPSKLKRKLWTLPTVLSSLPDFAEALEAYIVPVQWMVQVRDGFGPFHRGPRAPFTTGIPRPEYHDLRCPALRLPHQGLRPRPASSSSLDHCNLNRGSVHHTPTHLRFNWESALQYTCPAAAPGSSPCKADVPGRGASKSTSDRGP